MKNIIKGSNKNSSIHYNNENNEENTNSFFETDNNEQKMDIENNEDENDSKASLNYIDKYLTTIFDLENCDDSSSSKEKNINVINKKIEFKKTISRFPTKKNNLNDWKLSNTYEDNTMEKENEQNYISITKTLSIENMDSLDKEMNFSNENSLKLKKKKKNIKGKERNFLEKDEALNNILLFNKNNQINNYMKKNEENVSFPKNNSENPINKVCETKDPLYEDNAKKSNLSKIDDNMLKNTLFSLDEMNIEENIMNIRKMPVNNANTIEMHEEITKNKNYVLNQNLYHLLKYNKEFIYSYLSNNLNMENEELKEIFNIEEKEVLDKIPDLCSLHEHFQDSVNGNDKEHKQIDNEKVFSNYERNRNEYSDLSYLNETVILNDQSHMTYAKNTRDNKESISINLENSELCKNNSHHFEKFRDTFNSEMDFNNFSQINNNNYKHNNFNENYIITEDSNNNQNMMYHNYYNKNEVTTSNENSVDYFNIYNANSNVKNNIQKINTLNDADLIKNTLKYNSKFQEKINKKEKEIMEENMDTLYSKFVSSKNPILNSNNMFLYESDKNPVKHNININNSNSEIYQNFSRFLNNEVNKNRNYSINNNNTNNSNIDIMSKESKIHNHKNYDYNDLSFLNNYDAFQEHTNKNNVRETNDNNYNENVSLNEMASTSVLDKNYLKYSLNSNISSNINKNKFKKVSLLNETFNEGETNKNLIFEALKNKIKTLLENVDDDHLLSTHILDTLNDYNEKKYNSSNSICNDSFKKFKTNDYIETSSNKRTDFLENNDIVNCNSYNLNKELKEMEYQRNFNVLQNMENDELNNMNDHTLKNKSKTSYEFTDENNLKRTNFDNILRESKSNIYDKSRNFNINDLILFLNNNLSINKNNNQYTNMKNISSNDIEYCINHCDEFNQTNEKTNLSFSNSLLFNSQNNNKKKYFSTDEQIINKKDQMLNSTVEPAQSLEKTSFRNKNNFNYNANTENSYSYKLKSMKEDNNLKKNTGFMKNQGFNEKEGIYQNSKEENYEKVKYPLYMKNYSNIMDNESFENNFIDNTFKNNVIEPNSNNVKDQEKEKIIEYLQKYPEYEISDDYTKNNLKSDKFIYTPNKLNYYFKSKSIFNDKYKNENNFYKNSYLRNEYNWEKRTINEEEKNKSLSSNKEFKISFKKKDKFDKVWNRQNYLKLLSTKVSSNMKENTEDMKQKLKSKNSMPNLKSKKQSMDIKVLTSEEIKSLLTEEDEKDLEELLQSLYDDRILPLLFNVKGRAEELQYKDVIKNNTKTVYSLFPEKYLVKKNDSADDYIIYFANKKVQDDYFLSINNLKDIYDPNIWKEFEKYLEEIANSEDPSLYTFSGGRYGMAKELKRRNLPFFKGLYLGELCHIVHISTNKKIIAYENNYLKPISQCHKYTNAKMGIVNTSGSDIENYITTIDELRLYLNKLLKYYKGGFNISTLKKKLKNRFNKQICESVFHCIKLIEVLQLDELKDICVIDKESKIIKSAKNI